MPYVLLYSAMAESPDGKGVLLFGGLNTDTSPYTHEDKILELRPGADSWNILNITLEKRRTLTSRILIQAAMIMDKLLFMNH